MIDLRIAQLRSFAAVAAELHFGRAAEGLGLGQSAVSQHVRAVEEAVGTPLLERTSRSVALSPAGERLLPVVESILRDLDTAAAEARAVGAGELGTLRVAVSSALARTLIVPVAIADLAEATPGLTVELEPTTTTVGLDTLEDGTVDAALLRDPEPREGIEVEHLAIDPTMVALPAEHPLAGREALRLAELREMPRLGWNRAGAPEYHDRITALLDAEAVDPIPAHELRGVDTRLGAVAAGLGWSLESSQYRTLLQDRVRFVAIEGEPLRGEIVAAWPAVRRAPGLDPFLAAARRAAADL
jgi:DNA-binding transcriptional LysR family regulator